MRSETSFPIKDKGALQLCNFLNVAWSNGWLDEYSDEHFLIKAIENRLSSFVGKEQLIENNINLQGMINLDGSVNDTAFNFNFCLNFSRRMEFLAQKFGEENIKSFITDQMSAGKQNYKEDTFFQALSEVSILSFHLQKCPWMEASYEPPVVLGLNNKNPEARFIGPICCKVGGKNEKEKERIVTINVEVKSPEFPHDKHSDEKIAIPTMLLTDDGRKEVKKLCQKYGIKYLDPRVLKLRDFINSASSKFTVPKEDEFNLLYINWSYRDFPSNSFLEAWSLLTNEVNGILTCREAGLSIGISEDAYEKISAVVVYTESLEGLMFSDFRYVWQKRGAGTRFRMWVVDEKLREAELSDESNVLFYVTGMNPDKPLTQMAMTDCKSKTDDERIEAIRIGMELIDLIKEKACRYDE